MDKDRRSQDPWTSIDEEAQRFIATLDAPEDVDSLVIQMLYDTKTLIQKDVLLGYNFDPALLDVMGYPTEHGELETLWELTLALSPDVKKDDFIPEAVTVRDAQGKEFPQTQTSSQTVASICTSVGPRFGGQPRKHTTAAKDIRSGPSDANANGRGDPHPHRYSAGIFGPNERGRKRRYESRVLYAR